MSEEKVVVVASTNQGKIDEFRQMLEPAGYTVKSLKDLPHPIEIDETGKTFEENAVLKAMSVTRVFGIPAIADDSGLEIDAFGRAPGVYSARYLGHDTPYETKNRIILERMQGVKDRTCRYVCAIAWTRPGEVPAVFADTVECLIAQEPAGHNGFGYDSIVYYEPLGKTMAELLPEEKNAISHRGRALEKFKEKLREYYADK